MSDRPKDEERAALHILGELRARDYVALFAGGCVRDRLLGRTPKDFDVATNATPQQVNQVFPRARKVGAKFGVMLVRKYGCEVEVATFRTDGPYSDGRRPDHVVFGNEVDDAERRDFTINGLFYDPAADQVIDHVGGCNDLKKQIVRTIGDPDQRFGEDHLRMLRAVRFCARLGFEMAPSTLDAIKRLGSHLRAISPERIWREVEEILVDPHRARGWRLLVETELSRHLVDGWPQIDSDVLVERRLTALPQANIDPALGLAAIWRGAALKEVDGVSEAMRLSNRLAKRVAWLVSTLDAARDESVLELADIKRMMANPSWDELVMFLRADLMATGAGHAPVERLCLRASRIAAEDVAPAALITGDDLRAMGMQPGRRMGILLDAIYRAQLNEEIQTREEAVALAHAGVAK